MTYPEIVKGCLAHRLRGIHDAASFAVAQSAKERLAGRMEIIYVLPDYFEERPKPCMQGWGQRYLTVNPTGQVLPCPNATSIPDLAFDNVRDYPLCHIWSKSTSFNRYRGEDWMPLPCRTCPEREIDFGGCRCQASLLTGDSFATDPVCSFSPQHALLQGLVDQAITSPVFPTWLKRQNPAAHTPLESISPPPISTS